MIQKIDKTFYEITGIRLNNVSLLKLFGVLEDIQNDEKIFNIFKSYELNSEMESNVHYELHEVGHNEWWEYISYNYYGTPYLWWILPLINEVTNPFEWLEEGKFLKVLKPEYIYQLLKEIKTLGEL